MSQSTPLIQPTANDPFLLSNDTGRIKYRGSRVALVLSAEALYIFDFASKQTLRDVNLQTLIGAKCRKERKTDTFCYLDLFSYDFPKPSCCSCSSAKSKLRVREQITLKFSTSDGDCEEWSSSILSAMNNNNSYSSKRVDKMEEGGGGQQSGSLARRLLIFVNPVSGTRTAVRTFETIVKPMLIEAGADVKLIITQYANHAREFVKDFDYTQYDVVVTIGGDGMYYEVLNGILSRPDGKDILAAVPLMPIPGGTGNGLVKSILHETNEDYSVINATFAVLRGVPAPLDLGYVQTTTQSQYSFLLLGWGLISDIDILSETMRCLGEPRMYIAAVYFIMLKRRYRGRLSIYTGHRNPSLPALTDLPPLDTPIVASDTWDVIEGEFLFVWVLQTSHCSVSMLTGPDAATDDGLFTIYVLQNVSRASLLWLMLNIDSGGHHDSRHVKCYKTTAYRLEPLTDQGIFSLDGEVVEYGPIQGVVRPSMSKVLKVHK